LKRLLPAGRPAKFVICTPELLTAQFDILVMERTRFELWWRFSATPGAQQTFIPVWES
jgi:hypothetical protein